jgi:hypothetical protein
MDSSRFRGGAGRYARSRFTIENYPRWIPMAELDSTSFGRKRIFAVVSRPIGVGPCGTVTCKKLLFWAALGWVFRPMSKGFGSLTFRGSTQEKSPSEISVSAKEKPQMTKRYRTL